MAFSRFSAAPAFASRNAPPLPPAFCFFGVIVPRNSLSTGRLTTFGRAVWPIVRSSLPAVAGGPPSPPARGRLKI